MAVNITNTEIVCPKSALDIACTLTCGQFFRYFPHDDGSFELMSKDKYCKVYYDGDNAVIRTDDTEYFYRYFDLDTDYDKIISALAAFDELQDALTVSGGLRILRQEPFETVVSFIISANNNIKRIRGIVERLCAECGDKTAGGYYAFPTREQLMRLTAADYRRLGCGFRSEYLYETVPLLTEEYLVHIGTLGHDEALKALCKLKGVGPKVAECILLFAYKFTGSYPVDTWIFKAGRTQELNTPKLVGDYYSARYGEYAGYAQQYIFQYARTQKI